MEAEKLLDIAEQDGITVVTLNAEAVNMAELESIAGLLRNYIAQRRPARLIIDLGRLRFISSMMLGLLVDTWRRLKEYGGQLRICGIQSHLMRVFRITHLDRIFEFSPDRTQALEAMKQKS